MDATTQESAAEMKHRPGCACEYCGVLQSATVTTYLCGKGKVERVTRLMTWRAAKAPKQG